MTYTYAELGISQGAFDEIADALRKAGYNDAFHENGIIIDMHGIGVTPFVDTHKLDTDERVFFYEQDFYVLSNFSAFKIIYPTDPVLHRWFDTSEQCYHWMKFDHLAGYGVQALIDEANSAHEAFKIAERHKELRRPNWDEIKVPIMRKILRAKAEQHEYVRRKLLQTGDRELIEDSHRDPFWGWGPNRDGQNMLGKLWMEIRAELRSGGK